jgi:HD-GYP domain-containing protein (c-di-GMP phosphodiesterase class II)
MEWAERQVAAQRERRPQPLASRARRAELVSSLAFIAAAVGTALLVPFTPDADPLLIAALVAGYATILRIEFEIGPCYVVPEILVLVPALFLVPLPLVAPLVVTASALAMVPDFVSGRVHIDRWLHSVSNAWFALGPVLVIGLLAPGEPRVEHIGIYGLAFLAQLAANAGPTLLLQRVGHGVPVADTFQALPWIYRVDAILWPIGLMVAVSAAATPFALLAIAPLVWLLSEFSRERRERYGAALELNRAYRGTVLLLSDVVEADDNYTGSHCRSVVELVTAVAEELEIDEDERQELEFAALLHDVGKIAIPKDILNKPAKLTREEFELMKTHTIEGQHMLDRVGGLLGRVGRIVRSCHERWDGTGYPDGLTGEEIPLAARLVFCCDAYNAMTTDRPYRQALPTEVALSELRDNAGSQFDPWVVAGLIRVVERGQAEPWPSPEQTVRAILSQRPPGV